MPVNIGSIEVIKPRGPVPRPPRRVWERTVILDIGPIVGATEQKGRAFFKLRRPLARDREVGFTLGEIKAANFRPGLYRFRIEIPVDPLTSPKGATLVKAGEIVPLSVPPTVTFNDIRLIDGTFVLARQDIVIQAFDEMAPVEIKPVEPEPGVTFEEVSEDGSW